VTDDDLAVLPVDVHCLSDLQACVDLAQKIDRAQHRCNFTVPRLVEEFLVWAVSCVTY